MDSSSVLFQLVVNLGVVALGLALGSFLNVVIYRLMYGGSFLTGRSACPSCGHVLGARDLVPILSFFALKGKCRYCAKPISRQYPAVEFAVAALFILLWIRFGVTPAFALLALSAMFLVIIFVYDLRYGLILDRVALPAIAVAVAASFTRGLPWTSILLGAGVGFLVFYLQFVISKGTWVGGGDIRLGALMGALLGWQGVILALFLAYVGGTAVAIPLLILKRKQMKDPIPFGTFLTAATMFTLLYGDGIIEWYTTTIRGIW